MERFNDILKIALNLIDYKFGGPICQMFMR